MKSKILTALSLALPISSCQKEPEAPSDSESKLSTQFERSDRAIEGFFDKLAPMAEKKQIVCVDFLAEYKNNYIPASLNTAGNTYTEEKLLSDLKQALDY
ncbi:hypothetical protein [Acinetobacter bereziniae]|uniref:hypothetical protein n=1 Tax=Acinetobacter bereziniae TaxID=106648 RepID=UPI001250B95B|nr:hypothetical protein [Acinetobacter bereziniae]